MSFSKCQSTSYALTTFEKETLSEFRKYAKRCQRNISTERREFEDKGSFGLWRDAKGVFKSSNKADVTSQLEKCEKMYDRIYSLSAKVEKGDLDSYDELVALQNDLKEEESDAEYEVGNNRSKTVCQMLREFLDKKYHLDHNLKKLECVVLRQRMHAVEQANKRARDEITRKSRKMDELIEENRVARRESDERLMQAIAEANGRSDQAIAEANRRSDRAIAEANRRSEEMAEQNRSLMLMMMKILERMNVQ